MTAEEGRLARLALSLLAEPGDPVVARAVRDQGPVEVLHSWGRESSPALARADRMLVQTQVAGHRWVCP